MTHAVKATSIEQILQPLFNGNITGFSEILSVMLNIMMLIERERALVIPFILQYWNAVNVMNERWF